MQRIVLRVFLALIVYTCGAQACSAYEIDALAEQAMNLVKSDPKTLPGFSLEVFLNVLQLVGILIIFLIWVRSADWVNRDLWTRRANKNWNLAIFLPFAIAFLISWLVPYFAIGYPLMLAAYLVPFFIYVNKRNAEVDIDDMVFTGPHIRYWLSTVLGRVGIKIAAEAKSIDDIGAPVKLIPQGGATERDDAVNLMAARHSPGYLPARELLAEAFASRATTMMLDYTAEAVGVRYLIDGVWRQGEGRDRETGDAALAVFKAVSALNVNERRARQTGTFAAEYEKNKWTCRITTQGTATGERAVLLFDDGKAGAKRFADLGMRQKMQEELKQLLAERAGLIIVSAPAGGGLSTLYLTTVTEMDRYTRGFIAVENGAKKEMSVENVVVTPFDAAKGETPATVLPKLIREYPDVIIVPDMVDAASAELLCDQTKEDRMVITTTRAKEASEALLRVMALGMPADKYADAVKVVLNVRLVRKLCEQCKEAYEPTPQVLQQLGIPKGRVQALYRPPTPNPEQPQEPCTHCQGVGYHGRTGIFEMMVVSDEVRQVLLDRPKLDRVRQAARKSGMRTLQEEGIVLVAKGVTSLPELMRVLKE